MCDEFIERISLEQRELGVFVIERGSRFDGGENHSLKGDISRGSSGDVLWIQESAHMEMRFHCLVLSFDSLFAPVFPELEGPLCRSQH